MKTMTYSCDLCGKEKEFKDIYSLATSFILNDYHHFEICSDCLCKLEERKAAMTGRSFQ